MTFPIQVSLTVEESVQQYDLYVSESTHQYNLSSASMIGTSLYPMYSGATTVTPTRQTQVLSTGGFALAENITINPIPSNYGLITWNGSVLTVS